MSMRRYAAFLAVFAAGFGVSEATRKPPAFSPTEDQPVEIAINLADETNSTGRRVLRAKPYSLFSSSGGEQWLEHRGDGELVWVTLTTPRGGITYYATVTTSSSP